MDATESNAWFDGTFASMPLMAIFRGLGTARTLELAQAAWQIGIDIVEVPIQSDADVEVLRKTAALAAASGRIVGAGTVTTLAQVASAREAGAIFTVSPGFDPEIVAACLAAGLPTLPGVATASEVQAAVGLGLLWVKAFPASVLGSGWFAALHGPFPEVNFVATGGLGASNAGEFLAAGARVVAVGSAISNPNDLPALARLAAGGR
jgi:2-dehydro-3-deoxyphosphogluconate aldolase / (4S)-4-hydroxy-2-oxoglutarate aldolase